MKAVMRLELLLLQEMRMLLNPPSSSQDSKYCGPSPCSPPQPSRQKERRMDCTPGAHMERRMDCSSSFVWNGFPSSLRCSAGLPGKDRGGTSKFRLARRCSSEGLRPRRSKSEVCSLTS